jgi:hypothetical protein
MAGRKNEPEAPHPGTAGMAQGQPAAGVTPGEPGPPEQPDTEQGGATGAENLVRQQTDPDLDDTAGGHP